MITADKDDQKIINFTTKYAGKDVHILDGSNHSIVSMARIIGYYLDISNTLLVDFPNDPSRQKNCWSIADSAMSDRVKITLSDENIKSAFCVALSNVRLITEHKPYPHTCKICKAPARRNRDAAICSNTFCKANRKYINSLKIIVGKADKDNIICCPICFTTIMDKIISATGEDHVYKSYVIECINNHIFTYMAKKNNIFIEAKQKFIFNGKVFVYHENTSKPNN